MLGCHGVFVRSVVFHKYSSPPFVITARFEPLAVASGVAISIVIFIAGVSDLGFLNAGGELCK